jgi:hypothetical protein
MGLGTSQQGQGHGPSGQHMSYTTSATAPSVRPANLIYTKGLPATDGADAGNQG